MENSKIGTRKKKSIIVILPSDAYDLSTCGALNIASSSGFLIKLIKYPPLYIGILISQKNHNPKSFK